MANAQTIAELNVTLTGDASGLQRMAGEAGKAMDQVETSTEGASKASEKDFKAMASHAEAAGDSWGKVADRMVGAGKTLTAAVTVPVAAAGVAAVKLASDMDETMNKIGETFGENQQAVVAWSNSSIESMGLAQQSALDAAALFGDMGVGMGIVGQQSVEMSTSLVQLAADMASFKNVSVERAQTALAGVYTGETEALKSLGIVMTQANLQEYARAQGITKTIDKMSQAELVELRYQYVMAKTANAQGDFARTSDGVANQTRMAAEQVKQLGVSFGQQLLPLAAKALTWANDMLKRFTEMPPATQKTVIAVAGVAAAIGPLLIAGGKLIDSISDIKKALNSVELAGFIGKLTGMTAAEVAAGAAAAGSTPTVYALGTAFTALKAAAGPIAIVLGVVGAAVWAAARAFSGGGGLTEAQQENQKVVEQMTTDYEQLRDTLDDANATLQEQTGSAKESAQGAEVMARDLQKLMQVEQKSAAQKKRVLALVDSLNAAVPELNLAYDEERDSLNLTTDAIYASIEARKQAALAAAYQEQIVTYANAVAEAEIQLQKATEKRNELEQEKTRLINEATAAGYAQAEGVGELTSQIGELDTTILGLRDAQAEANANLDTATRMAGDYAVAAETATGATSAQAQATQEAAGATEEYANKAAEANEKIASQYESMKSTVTSAFDRMKTSGQQSVAEMTKNLEENTRIASQWADDLETLAKRGVDDGLLQQLRDAGPESAAYARELVNASDAELAKLEDAYRDSVTASQRAAAQAIDDSDFENAAKLQLQKVSSAVREDPALPLAAAQAVSNTKTSAADKLRRMNFDSLGRDMMSGAASGVSSNAYRLENAAANAAQRAVNAMRQKLNIHSPSKVTEEIFRQVVLGGVVGYEKTTPQLTAAATGSTAKAIEATERAVARQPVSLGTIPPLCAQAIPEPVRPSATLSQELVLDGEVFGRLVTRLADEGIGNRAINSSRVGVMMA